MNVAYELEPSKFLLADTPTDAGDHRAENLSTPCVLHILEENRSQAANRVSLFES